MKAVVTGATGFLAGHLCDRLIEDGADLAVTTRGRTPLDDRLRARGVDVHQCELGDLPGLERAFNGAEVVFHLAAEVSYLAPADRLERTNVTGTRNVLLAARRRGVRRLVFASTESVTLVDGDRVAEDEDAPSPEHFLDPYSRSKADAEHEVLHANGKGFETVVVRPPWVWGEGDRTVLKLLVRMVERGVFAFVGDGKNRITTCHAGNAAAGFVAAATSPRAPGRVYHVADDDGHPTIAEFVGRLCDACGLRRPTRRVPYRVAWAAAAVVDRLRAMGVRRLPPITRPFVAHLGRTWTLSDRRAREEIGYRPALSPEEGWRRLAAERSG